MQIIGPSSSYNNTVTAASGTADNFASVSIPRQTINATNSNVITNIASSLLIRGSPIAGTNQTINNPYAIHVQSGTSRFGGPISFTQPTTPSAAISLVAPSTTFSTYNLTLPTSLPTATGQALISDILGNLSWGSAAATQSMFNGANNVTTPTSVTGLSVSTSPISIPVYVQVNATNSLFAIITIFVFYNSAASSYMLDYNSVGDNTGIRFDVTAAGQIVYYSANYAGFSSLTFTWFSPFTPVSSTLASLNLSNTLSVGSSTTLATSSISGTPSSTNGNLLFVNGSTFTDTTTAASATTAAFNGIYIAAPTLKASNTAVTTSTASTVTIAGAPNQGTNETINNAYSFNVLTGASLFGGSITTTGLNVTGNSGITDAGLISVQYTAPNIINMTINTTYYPSWSVSSATSKYPATIVPTTLVAANGQINIPQAGVWRIVVDINWQSNTSTITQGNYSNYQLGTKTAGGVPTTAGYLSLQLIYEQYFSAPGSIPGGFLTQNYSGANAVGLVMNITRIAR